MTQRVFPQPPISIYDNLWVVLRYRRKNIQLLGQSLLVTTRKLLCSPDPRKNNVGEYSGEETFSFCCPFRIQVVLGIFNTCTNHSSSPVADAQLCEAIENWRNLNKFAINTTTPLSILVNGSGEGSLTGDTLKPLSTGRSWGNDLLLPFSGNILYSWPLKATCRQTLWPTDCWSGGSWMACLLL